MTACAVLEELMEDMTLATSALSLFRNADWKRLQLELTHYAVAKIQRLRWRTAQGLPKGTMPEDLALSAIQKTLEGLLSDEEGRGIRKWRPEQEPDLLGFLKSVVDSDVSSLVNLEEHKLTNYSPDLQGGDAHEALQSQIDKQGRSASDLGDAESLLAAKQSEQQTSRIFQALMSELAEVCSGDEDELGVLRAFSDLAERQDNLKPSLVAQYLGISEERVRNARRRIERKTRAIRAKIMKEEERRNENAKAIQFG